MNVQGKRLVKILRHIVAGLLLLSCPLLVAAAPSDHLVEIKTDDATRTIYVIMDDAFGKQEFTEKSLRKLYKTTTKDVHKALPREYRKYKVRIMIMDTPIEDFKAAAPVPEQKPAKKKKRGGWWGGVSFGGTAWVSNVSQPHTVKAALGGKHLAVWASHGKFYDVARKTWRWQRPNMFCTNEDLFTQTIVVPYLIPMLERAGANVFSPRERDWQTQEVIVDDADAKPYYIETHRSGKWHEADVAGFSMPRGTISDGFNPFGSGRVREVHATRSDDASTATYQPLIPKEGRYAVYVSYATVEKSVDDALYSVYHQGMRTDFRVNQQMGGGTWVYLGTFDFDAGCNEYNRVVVSAQSASKGIVTTDAVRFGGGMGNVERGGKASGMPRCLEGARYYAQWAGAPYERYSVYKGTDDYKDDINARSLMTNWLAGGSPYAPQTEGKKVPIDLTLAIHSDAGFNSDLQTIYGSLAVCTTDQNGGMLDAGKPRSHSRDLCQALLDQTKKDLTERYGTWNWRDLYDRNYSETRLPVMPSAIFETLSHQSFPDMMMAHDPDFKFTLARSIYKTVLRYEAAAHGEKAVVMPLQPVNFHITLDRNGNAQLQWMPQRDKTEPTAMPSSYNLYTAMGGLGYDNGVNIEQSKYTVRLVPDLTYRFRVTAVNDGGESFPTEELCVVWHGENARTVLVVNGFQRLSGPAVRNNAAEKGFDLYEDPGVSYGMTAGWAGMQQTYSTATAGREGPGTFGYNGDEMAGAFVAGNSFNYVAEHAAAIASANQYNVVSTTKSAVEWGDVNLQQYDMVDLILGNERHDGHSLQFYKTFSKAMQKQLLAYRRKGRGALLVSGSYMATDMQQPDEQAFLRELLGCYGDGTVRSANYIVKGLQQTLGITSTLNPDHYATIQSDVIQPAAMAATGQAVPFVAMQYSNGKPAAVAVQGNGFSTFAMGFPFECITTATQRALTMRGILAFLMNK